MSVAIDLSVRRSRYVCPAGTGPQSPLPSPGSM